MTTRNHIEYVGQPFVDDPVYAKPRDHLTGPIARGVAFIFGNDVPKEIEIGTERVRLRWLKPDGHGGLEQR